jgi:hypothetical protein
MIFLPENLMATSEITDKEFENKYRIRPGYKFRSVILFGKGGEYLNQALQPEKFSSCAIVDASLNFEEVKQTIEAGNGKALERTWYFISNTDKHATSKTNGDLHMLLKKKDIYHEYRVSETSKKPAAFNGRIKEVFQFTARKMHR